MNMDGIVFESYKDVSGSNWSSNIEDIISNFKGDLSATHKIGILKHEDNTVFEVIGD